MQKVVFLCFPTDSREVFGTINSLKNSASIDYYELSVKMIKLASLFFSHVLSEVKESSLLV